MISAVRHVGIVVSDLEKQLGFYRGLLGLEVVADQMEEGEFVSKILGVPDAMVRTVKLLASNGSIVELLCFVRPESTPGEAKKLIQSGITHAALTVENVDSLYRSLNDKGYEVTTEPLVSPNGMAKVTFCKDPEGNWLELVEELGIHRVSN